MKRNLILAVVVVVALVAAATGGVFATWSDSETSYDNEIRTGSVDLKVNGQDDEPWGSGVPSKFSIDCMIPQKFYGPYEVELWNAGQCTFPSHAYLEVKRIECGNILPKENNWPENGSFWWWLYHANDPDYPSTGYQAPDGSGLKPEPELVAEYGGHVDCFEVPGIGPEGDECSMGTHTEMIITLAPLPPNDDYYLEFPEDMVARDKMVKWLDKEVYLFDLMPCEPKTIYMWFYLQQDSEEMYGYDFVCDPGDECWPDPEDYSTLEEYEEAVDAAMLYWHKFNDWPSWALMKDKADIDVEFDLWLEDTPGGVVYPY